MSRSSNKSRPAGKNRPASALSAVVLVGYGPRSATRGLTKAIHRTCAELKVDLIEIAAFDPDTGKPARAGEQLFDQLVRRDDGPVLYIHDDVAIDDTSLDRLVSAHLAGAAVAVPASNDVGTAHFHGKLPPASVARAELKKLSRTGDGSTSAIETFRPSCMVTSRATLVSLLDKRIHDPFTLVTDRGIGLEMVSGAYCAHDGMCGKAVRAAVSQTDRPVLVASLIVKNEEAMLADCLASMEGLVDRIEVVDTGSTDSTVEIARRFGANVTEIEWRDDFAWARNQAAELCRDAMFTLWIDADERVVTQDASLTRDLFAACFDEIEAFDVRLANLSDGNSDGASSTVRLRRVVRSDLLAFAGRVHEQPVRLGDERTPLVAATFDALRLDHLGYTKEVIDRQGKRDRNLRLAKAQHGEDRSLKASVDLARSLLMVGDYSGEAVRLLRDAVAELEASGETRADWTAYLYGSLAHVLLNTGELEEALEWSTRAFHTLPSDDLAAAVLATASLDLGREAEFLALIGRFDEPTAVRPVFESPQNKRVVREATVRALARVGDTGAAWAQVEEWLTAHADLADGALEAASEVACLHFHDAELPEALARLAAHASDPTALIRPVSGL
ncbi:MAG: glycosyltransferase, partial [Acidimicrobiales bacterium]|nr:glycosyltransferase [Acidimicrobiales bacterium]